MPPFQIHASIGSRRVLPTRHSSKGTSPPSHLITLPPLVPSHIRAVRPLTRSPDTMNRMNLGLPFSTCQAPGCIKRDRLMRCSACHVVP